ncbi:MULTISPECIES: FecR family protein [Niastella]|uniref:FecR family protein n=1 Tax=Niastella soli TaxID=2821487 RepID=A0ABS3YPJ7_9BACT|nr:FecR family protein [Niastella soli]MBO9199790.1 FecR family protein [Niastella soli]
MHPKDIQELLKKYREGTCTEAEKALLERWYQTYEAGDFPEIPPHIRDEHLNEVWQSLPVHENKVRRMPWLQLAAAAVLLITFATVLYLYINKPVAHSAGTQPVTDNTIMPGSNKAILTLNDGRRISLTDAANGHIADQAGITVTKKADGQLFYTISESGANETITFNTIETPRGGQYQVALPDGTKVWLNAATSLRFPTKFSATERIVYLDGEAYFEVAHNKNSPFKVAVNGQQVEVLGTHFNIMAYKDENTIRTTLLEGSVKLTAPVGSLLLEPGQQGYIAKSAFTHELVDVTIVTAWKNGLFKFNGIDLRTLMRQISRWYDIEVVYEPGVKDDVVFGSISRTADLTKLLHILELGGVHFKQNGRKLIVMQ